MIRNFLKKRVLVCFTLLMAFLLLLFVHRLSTSRKKPRHVVFERGDRGRIITVPILENRKADGSDDWISKTISDSKGRIITVPILENRKADGSDDWISKTISDSKQECPPLLRDNIKKNISAMSCQIPNLDPFHPSMLKLLGEVPMPSCADVVSYGKLVGGKISFTNADVVSATYRRIVREGDFRSILGTSVPVPKTEKITDEFIEVDYLLKNGEHAKEVFMQPVPHGHLLKRTGQKKPGIPLNILIIVFDSLSHANAQRKLPKAYKFLKELGSFNFNGHSIVGDGTTEQLAAMLTGLGELEQYESRRHHSNPKPVDNWTWIYKQLKAHGYLTGYSEDRPALGSFQYRLMGFKDKPNDFYPRPFFQKVGTFLKGGNSNCLGSRTILKCQFDYVCEIFDMFPEKMKFFLSFNDAYSHNSNNGVAKAEPDLLFHINNLKQKGHLNNTLLIVMGDHGARYGQARALLQGKLEERLPFFSMLFPPWFTSRYPKLVDNLRTNTDRLTSWFDVYATYRHMLSYPAVPSDLKHGKSLLLEIPASRTCADATVEEHWCPCLEWSAVNAEHSHVRNSALAAVEYMNSAIKKHAVSAIKCEKLSLKSINYALLERPNEKLLSFHQTNDLIPAFNEKSKPAHKDFCRYQIQFVTAPNNGVYEATVRYHKTSFIVSKSISRVNKYGDQPECIAKVLPHLRKFCLCKKNT